MKKITSLSFENDCDHLVGAMLLVNSTAENYFEMRAIISGIHVGVGD